MPEYSKRDARFDFTLLAPQTYRVVMNCPYMADAEFVHKSRFPDGIAAKCELEDEFLESLSKRMKNIIENCSSFDAWAEKSEDPTPDAFHKECKWLERMDIWFDDAENFFPLAKKSGFAFGYAVFEDESRKEPATLMAYIGDNYAGHRFLENREDMDFAKKLIEVCRRGTRERGDIRFQKLKKELLPPDKKVFDKCIMEFRLVENEFSKERPFSGARERLGMRES